MDDRYIQIDALYTCIRKAYILINNAKKKSNEEYLIQCKEYITKAKNIYEYLHSNNYQIDYLQEIIIKNKVSKLENKYKSLLLLETRGEIQ